MTRRHILRLLAGFSAAALAAGCGKKGRPNPPDPDKAKYPRQYPKPL